MKKIVKYLICFLAIFACQDDKNLLEDLTIYGGFVQFEEPPTTLNLNILNIDTQGVSERLVDANNNALSYSLTLYYEDQVVNDFLVFTSFPADLEISMSSVVSALGITLDDIELSTIFSFVATIETTTGTFSGLSPDYDDNNVNQGGDSTVRLKAGGLKGALEFQVSFFQPPAKTIRKTSFEEVTIGPTDEPFRRTGGNDETADLINGDDPPYVDYTAVGSTVDDEIGFNTEYVAVPGITGSAGVGLGFVTERIGVYSLLEDYDAYPDGTQGYHAEDIDGMIKIVFDIVNVPDGQNKSGVSFDVYFNSTSWESLDGLHAYANITTDAGSEVLELANYYDDDVEAIAGSWVTINSGFQTGVRSYQLVLELSNSATPESIDIDNVVIYEPENE